MELAREPDAQDGSAEGRQRVKGLPLVLRRPRRFRRVHPFEDVDAHPRPAGPSAAQRLAAMLVLAALATLVLAK